MHRKTRQVLSQRRGVEGIASARVFEARKRNRAGRYDRRWPALPISSRTRRYRALIALILALGIAAAVLLAAWLGEI
jgi:hypothetical protein